MLNSLQVTPSGPNSHSAEAAEKACVEKVKGGHLVSIHSREENEFIVGMLFTYT